MRAAAVEEVIERIAHRLRQAEGIDAVVLGGSRATGTAAESSDIDIGIYYDPEAFDLQKVRAIAAELDDRHEEGVITALGEWGPWINGGGWLMVEGMHVDILFRDMAKVQAVAEECFSGKITIDYQCGHPFGFVNAIYVGEAACCKVLWSSNDKLSKLRTRALAFPESYRRAAARKFMWECQFSENCGRKAIEKEDVVYAAGSLFRCAVCLVQVLSAVNRIYLLNEKGGLRRLEREAKVFLPQGFCEDMERVFTRLGTTGRMEESFDLLAGRYREIQGYLEEQELLSET